VREQRRRAARIVDAARLAPERCDDPTENATRSEFGAAFAAGLQRLDEPFRSVLEQHLVHGRKAHEIAAQVGETAGAVRMRIHRGLDRLRRHLPRAGFATGAVALRMPPAAFANVRAAVLGKLPGGPAIPASAVFGVLGTLTLSKALLAGAAAIALACGVCLWPSSTDAPMPVRRERDLGDGLGGGAAGDPGPDADQPRRQCAAPAIRTELAAPPARGTLRIVVRTAWNDAPIANTSVQVGYGLEAKATSRSTADKVPVPSAVSTTSAEYVASGWTTATTDDTGVTRVELPVGRARISVPVFAANPTVVADVRAGVETECKIAIPAEFTAVVRVADGDRPIAGARILGVAASERCLVERELGTTDDAGRWSEAFADPYATVRAVARGRAASAPVRLEKDNRDRVAADRRRRRGRHRHRCSAATGRRSRTPRCCCTRALPAEARWPPIAVRTSANGSSSPATTCSRARVSWSRRADSRAASGGSRCATSPRRPARPRRFELRFPVGARLAARVMRANGDTGGHCNITLAPLHPELPRSLRSLANGGCRHERAGRVRARWLVRRFVRAAREREGAIDARTARRRQTREVVATLDAIEWHEVEVVDEAGSPLVGWIVTLGGDARHGRDDRTLAGKGRARFERLTPGAHEVMLRHERAACRC
jgi:hypothetical protein